MVWIVEADPLGSQRLLCATNDAEIVAAVEKQTLALVKDRVVNPDLDSRVFYGPWIHLQFDETDGS